LSAFYGQDDADDNGGDVKYCRRTTVSQF